MSATAHSITGSLGDAPVAPRPVSDTDIAKAARYTLLSMDKHRSVGQLAMRYVHEGKADTKYIAYATKKKCVYGPRFATMDRFSQTFVVFHETMHHVLGHIEHGALLYKREGARFSGIIYNIACDAIINFVGDQLPNVDKNAAGIKYGVRKCQEFGIVNWTKIQEEVKKLSAETQIPASPIFDLTPDKLTSPDIYYALMRLVRQTADKRAADKANQDSEGDAIERDGVPQPGAPGQDNSPTSEGGRSSNIDNIIDELADAIGGHDDLSDAIKDASTAGEGELLDNISRNEDVLRRVQAGAGSGDAILSVKRPDGQTKTPWPQATRRILNSALINRPTINPNRPARRVVSQMARALDPRIPEADRPKGIMFEPRRSTRRPAKKCVTIIDTSGSIIGDKQTLNDFIRESGSVCKRLNSTQIIIFADADVCSVVDVKDCAQKIAALEPRGGGGTDFRPAIALAETFSPDAIIYLTDLMGTFPEKKPRAPIIWGYPPEYDRWPTPFGIRLPLIP